MLPPLEAMVCGCPCVVASAASLPEVGGDAVLYCDPLEPEDLATKVRDVITDPTLRDELRRRGMERAAKFSWRHTADRLFQSLDRLGPR